jgi:hypothetical protein
MDLGDFEGRSVFTSLGSGSAVVSLLSSFKYRV